ncbi:MAG: HD-GYP domain-containing protein [Lachnospiraceae bacterium]|nr:HD-GYP domain-containing protein [Lachnospiraceae bacterium]
MKELMKLKTSFAEPGMILGKDIYSSSDYLIAGEGTVLTDRMITRLKFYSVAEIVIFTPDNLRKKEPKQPVPAPIASFVGRIKTSPEYRTFTKTFYSTFISYKGQLNEVVQNKAPLNTENLLADVSKIFASCKNPNSLLDMMMCIRNLDDATYVHSMNVALICNLFAYWLKYDEEDTQALTLAGLLHDIGKMMIPPEIIKKPGKLTEDEYRVIQEHPTLGYNILKEKKVDPRICNAALMHHERCDGRGYPKGLTLNEIDPFAKIVAIADVYDALTAARVYRGPICPLEVIGIFQAEGLSIYDPGYLMTFLDQIMYSYLDYTIKLSNGETGRIIMMQRNSLDKPVIALENGDFIDLRDHPDLSITGVV